MEKQFFMSEDQRDLQQLVREFARKEIAPRAGEWDREEAIPREYVDKAMEMGLHLLNVAEEYGGMGLDHTTAAIIKEELGWADPSFAVLLAASALGYTPVALAGNEDQNARFAEILAGGGIAAFCLTEAQSGSDASNCRTTAKRQGDEYVINGTKTYITNGGIADVFTVFAITDKEKGAKGVSAFMVEKSRGGVSVGKKEDKLGIRASNTCEVIFEDVKIPAANLLGSEGDGFTIAMQTLDRTRPSVAAIAVGLSQRAIDECVAYAKERVTFGKPISKYQGVSFMIADMEIQNQAARQMVNYATRLIDAGAADSSTSAIAKTFASDAAMRITTDAVQVLGGYGYSREYPVEKLMRDAKIFQIFEGTNQIQRMVVAGGLFR